LVNLDNRSHGQNHIYAFKGLQVASPTTPRAISMLPKSLMALNTSAGPFPNHV